MIKDIEIKVEHKLQNKNLEKELVKHKDKCKKFKKILNR